MYNLIMFSPVLFTVKPVLRSPVLNSYLSSKVIIAYPIKIRRKVGIYMHVSSSCLKQPPFS